MKGQNIKKYQQKELNLMFKTDEKTRNYMIALPWNQLPNRRNPTGIQRAKILFTFKT